MISEEQARAVAHENASQVYRDLSLYDVTARLEGAEWHVGYRLKDPGSVGGGPHYVISAETGEIVSRRFAQ